MSGTIPPLPPAFRTPQRAAAFAVLVGALLALPWVLRILHVPGHGHRFETAPVRAGPYSYLNREIFEERGDLDAVILGDSVIWVGLETPLVEKALAEMLGRPARVITLGWNWQGTDLTYTVLRELLARRKVHTVIMRLPVDTAPGPHPQSFRWLLGCEHDTVFPTLPLREQIAMWGIEATGALRNVLTLLRPNRLAPSPYEATHGAAPVRRAFNGGPLQEHVFPVVTRPAGEVTTPIAEFPSVTPPHPRPWAEGYTRGIRALLDEHHVRAVFIQIPSLLEAREKSVPGDGLWAAHFPPETPVIALPPAELFAGFDDATLQHAYYDVWHLNRSGARFFTQTHLPALLEALAHE